MPIHARAAALLGLFALLAASSGFAQGSRSEPLALRSDSAWTELRITLRDGRQVSFKREEIAGAEYRIALPPPPAASPVGTWAWVQGQTLVVQADGTCQVYLNGQRINDCQWVSLGGGRYRLTHRSGGYVDTVTLSPDGAALNGVNNTGYALHGSRTGGAPVISRPALPGRWNWVSGQVLVIAPDQTCQVFLNGAQINSCVWVSLGGDRYRLTHRSGGWVDTITLSADGRKITGVNNQGYTLNGSRQ